MRTCEEENFQIKGLPYQRTLTLIKELESESTHEFEEFVYSQVRELPSQETSSWRTSRLENFWRERENQSRNRVRQSLQRPS